MEVSEYNDLAKACAKFTRSGNYKKAFECLENMYRFDVKVTMQYLTPFRQAVKACVQDNVKVEANMEILHQSYLLTAPDYFDDFMIALEWYRPNPAKFWLVRREKLLDVANTLQKLEDGEMDELFLSMPPRVGKSTIVMMFIIWVMYRHPELSSLYSSFTEKVVKTFYNGIMEVICDPITYDLANIFPGVKLAATDAKDLLINIGRKKRYASLTSRSIDGTLNGACDASGYIIADDLLDGISEAKNKVLLDKKWGLVTNNLMSRAKGGCKKLWIGTRWSLYDPIQRRVDMLQTSAECASVRFQVINVPAMDRYDESNFDYLYGKGYTTEALRVVRAQFEVADDMASWLAQYMGTPIERDGAVFEPTALRYYNGVLPEGDPDRIFMTVDPAWGGGDYVAAPVIFQFGDDLFVHDAVYNCGDKKITQPQIAAAARKHGVQAMYIEATRTTASYAEGVEQRLHEMDYKLNLQKGTTHFTGTGKEQRIYDRAPDIKASMLFLDTGKRSKEYQLAMNEMLSFTMEGKNKHDDFVDALAMACQFAFRAPTQMKIMQRPF